MDDTVLLQRFIAAFDQFDEMVWHSVLPIPPELDAGCDDSHWARQMWRPAAIDTDRGELVTIYEKLPAPFPPLFEQLVRSYRWGEITLAEFVTLFADPPGPNLGALLSAIVADAALANILSPRGFVPFGRAPDGRYDAVCFDTARRLSNGDCPVVLIEHEAVLSDHRIGTTGPVTESFRALVELLVAKAGAES